MLLLFFYSYYKNIIDKIDKLNYISSNTMLKIKNRIKTQLVKDLKDNFSLTEIS
jgi:hypothetical protein